MPPRPLLLSSLLVATLAIIAARAARWKYVLFLALNALCMNTTASSSEANARTFPVRFRASCLMIPSITALVRSPMRSARNPLDICDASACIGRTTYPPSAAHVATVATESHTLHHTP